MAAASEQCRRLLGLLEDDEMRRIAMGKVHGQTNEEIAVQEQLSVRTVEREVKHHS